MAEDILDIEGAKRRILFICPDNSIRSQMAEAFVNKLYPGEYEAHSAGTEPMEMDEHVLTVMNELGIDVSKQHAKSVDDIIKNRMTFDVVATMCNCTRQTCPYFPAREHIHMDFPDPRDFDGNHEEMLMHFRRLRNQIRGWVESTFGERGALENYINVRNAQ
jgi:arsenate reductase